MEIFFWFYDMKWLVFVESVPSEPDEPLWPKTVGFCDLLGTPYAPVSKIPSVKSNLTCFNIISMISWKRKCHYSLQVYDGQIFMFRKCRSNFLWFLGYLFSKSETIEFGTREGGVISIVNMSQFEITTATAAALLKRIETWWWHYHLM